jgi:hypothetical protein
MLNILFYIGTFLLIASPIVSYAQGDILPPLERRRQNLPIARYYHKADSSTNPNFSWHPPRYDDHFYRKKVVYLLDLKEKKNRPLTYKENVTYYSAAEGRDGRILEKDGFIASLLKAYEEKKLIGYQPKPIYPSPQPLEFGEFKTKFMSLGGQQDVGSLEEGSEEDDGEDFEEEDSGFEDEGASKSANPVKGDDMGGDSTASQEATDYPSLIGKHLESLVEIVEDRIFDKNKSDMYYDLQYIRLMFVDPKGVIPNQYMVAFKYEDAMKFLNETQHKNRQNDAEYRTSQEIFELRDFNSFIVNFGGEEMGEAYLREGELRRQQVLEFEHHLWEF